MVVGVVAVVAVMRQQQWLCRGAAVITSLHHFDNANGGGGDGGDGAGEGLVVECGVGVGGGDAVVVVAGFEMAGLG